MIHMMPPKTCSDGGEEQLQSKKATLTRLELRKELTGRRVPIQSIATPAFKCEYGPVINPCASTSAP